MTSFIKKNLAAIIVLAVGALVFAGLLIYARSGEEEDDSVRSSYNIYTTGRVTSIDSEDLTPQPLYENNSVGRQDITVKITSGKYKGSSLPAINNLTALYGTVLKEGDPVVLAIYFTNNEMTDVVVYEYNKAIPVLMIIAVFVVITVLVGGRKGAQSLLGLVFTVFVLIFILLPLLLKGFSTILTTLLLCIFVAVISYTLIGGVCKKTLCAMLGTAIGLIIAVLFALGAQKLARVDGMRMGDYIDGLLQLKFGGVELKLKGLLVAGVTVSALGAIMDVAMSISSALCELTTVHPGMTRREVIRSGFNIGRDMIGTMTNTLILAFVGSSFVMVLYIYTLGLPVIELVSSNLVACEVVHGIASSVSVILSVPVTILLSSRFYVNGNNGKKNR